MVLTQITFFLLYWQYLFPPAYIDMLSQCAAHLGGWDQCRQQAGYVGWQAWSQLQVSRC